VHEEVLQGSAPLAQRQPVTQPEESINNQPVLDSSVIKTKPKSTKKTRKILLIVGIILILIVALVELISLLPFESRSKEKNDLTAQNLFGKVKNYSISERYTNRDDGTEEKNAFLLNSYIFNEKGNKIIENEYEANTPKSIRSLNYDKEGHLIEDITSFITERFENSSSGLIHLPSDTAKHMIRFKYDAKGYKIEGDVISYRKESWKILYLNDDKGNCLTETWKYPNGKIVPMKANKYDNKGNLIEEKEFGSFGDLRTFASYKYDAKGNRVEIYDNIYKHTKKLKFDNRGRIIRMDNEEFTYDKRGNEIKHIYYNNDGSIQSNTLNKYEFDSRGNWTKKTEFLQKKTLIKDEKQDIIERTIEYY